MGVDQVETQLAWNARMEPGEGPLSGQPTLEHFVTEHSVALTRFAFLLCGDRQRAEDLVQDAFLALHRRFGAVLTVDAPVAYARKAIVNTHLSASRKKSSSEIVTEAPPDGVAEDGKSELWDGLSGLPARQRAVLVLRYWLDQTDDDIAKLLGCRRGTVRSLAARAFATLRTLPTTSEEVS